MRKQITIPDCYDDVIKAFANKSKTSESNIMSYAIMLLCSDFNSCNDDEETEYFYLQGIKTFYVDFYCKQLPRGLKAKEVANEKKKKT